MNVIQRLTDKYSPGVNFAWYLVVHDTQGRFPGDLNWLSNPDARVSVHYLVAPGGTVYQMVPDDRRAWHAGESSWAGLTGMNAYSVGIEISHVSAGSAPYPPAQLHALDELILMLYQKHRFRGARPIGHREIAPGRKSDPELNLNDYTWAKVEARLQEDIPMNAEQDKRLRDVEAAVVALATSARASSFRESISIAVALGDYNTADRLNAEAKAAGFVTGYTSRP